MPDDETMSLLVAHRLARRLLSQLHDAGARCRVRLVGGIRRLEERVGQVEMVVTGDMPLTERNIGPGFSVDFATPEQEGWASVERTGGHVFLADMKTLREDQRLPWPLPDGSDERKTITETFGEYIPPHFRSDFVDRANLPTLNGDALVFARVSRMEAKHTIASWLDATEGTVFVADDGGPAATAVALLNERQEDCRIKLATIISDPTALSVGRGSVVVLDASRLQGDGGRICHALECLREMAPNVLLFNPTARLPSNDLRGFPDDLDRIAAHCASLEVPVVVCGHPARLSPGDNELVVFLRADCRVVLASGASRPERRRFGIECAVAMASRAGAGTQDMCCGLVAEQGESNAEGQGRTDNSQPDQQIDTVGASEE